MVPAVVLPLAGWMLSAALPVIRDDFGLNADVAAWIATAFSLPFMIFMPVYGRISDGLGKRRLLIGGITIFVLGSIIALFALNLPMLLVGRAVQGFGVAGLVPLSLALITETFPAGVRGRAMGMWGTIGPLTGVIGPVLAGFIVAAWGWRSAFVPPLLAAAVGIGVIYWMIPSSGSAIDPSFLRRFDWPGVALLSLTLTFLLFYLSSRPITGVAPLQDWRLLGLTLLFLAAFVRHENRRENAFLKLRILGYRQLVIASTAAMLRMMGLSGGLSFLMPLYLADVVQLTSTQTGFYLMLNPMAMVLVVRRAGSLSDRWGSRNSVMVGFSIVAAVMLAFSRLSTTPPQWLILLLLAVFGVGTGLMLASLHRAALNVIPEADLGTSSGIYSMIRFLGSAFGAAVGGILLQFYFDLADVSVLVAYQNTFLWFVGFAALGAVTAVFLNKNNAA